MTQAADWTGQVGEAWAAEWKAVDRSLSALGAHLDSAILAAAPAKSFRTLDLGCGAGATSAALAAARPDAHVTGVDLSPALAEAARRRTADLANCHIRCGDALEEVAAVRPDLIVSRHGVMFFPDPVAAFARLREGAGPGAGLVFSCFGARADNRFATLADELLGAEPPAAPQAPGPFAFADRERVWTLLERAGWQVEAAVRVSFPYRIGTGPDAVAEATHFLCHIGPLAAAMREAGAERQVALRERLSATLEPYRLGDVVELPAVAWIWRACARNDT